MERKPIGWHYREARLRIGELARGLDDEQWATPVPACPGWAARDVIAHMLGIIDDANAGRLAGPPDDALTADQVERLRGEPPLAMLDRWDDLAEPFEAMITEAGIWPAAFDCVMHEHDLRGALGIPGRREHESIDTIATLVGRQIGAPQPVAVDLGDRTLGDEGADLTLRTTAFDWTRVRFGRRSRDQVLAMDWSADPTAVIDALFYFGPSPIPIVE